MSGFAKYNNKSTPTKNDGIEYKINKIKEVPLSIAESFLYAENIPIGILIKYAKNREIMVKEKDIHTFCHILVDIG